MHNIISQLILVIDVQQTTKITTVVINFQDDSHDSHPAEDNHKIREKQDENCTVTIRLKLPETPKIPKGKRMHDRKLKPRKNKQTKRREKRNRTRVAPVTELLNSLPVADCDGMKPPPANRDASPAPPLSEYMSLS